MPIRFRCAYCTQLMSIAQRKAGTVVRCPKCAGEIIVPTPEGESAASSGPRAFEDANFDVNLESAAGAPAPSTATVAADAGPQALAEHPANQANAPDATAAPRRLGVFVPIGMLLISIGAVILLLILMFIIGLIIGQQAAAPG